MLIQSASVPLDGVEPMQYWSAPSPISRTWGAGLDLSRLCPPLIGSSAQLTDNRGAQWGIGIRVVCLHGLRSLYESFVLPTKGKQVCLFHSSFTGFLSVVSCLCESPTFHHSASDFFAPFFFVYSSAFVAISLLLCSKGDRLKSACNGFWWLAPLLGWVLFYFNLFLKS